MNFQTAPLAPGLYLVATPIGTARDITLRALDTLASADLLVAEDTRSLRHLLAIHGVPLAGRQVLAYHDHSGPEMRARILAAVTDGKSVAYASEAGTPLIADPGFALVAAMRDSGLPVTAVPGPSAVIAALTLAGLPTDRFLFLGFAPPKSAARRALLKEVAAIDATLVFYESPKRVQPMLADMAEAFGASREVVMCRELTKRFEEIRRDTVAALAESLLGHPPRGECVLVVAPPAPSAASEAEIGAALRAALATLSVKDAARDVAERLGVPKREVYQMALALARKDGG